MVDLSEIAFILKQINELDASKNVLFKKSFISYCYNIQSNRRASTEETDKDCLQI